VRQAREALQDLVRRARHGALLRDGVRVVLAGKPNVGKSSLLNALLRRDRAIVTPIAGTTRDTLEEALDIHGLPMFLVDTAGLNQTDDVVERLGIARSTEALRSAAIVILVFDCSQATDEADRQAAAAVLDAAPEVPLILVRNKADLPRAHPFPDDETLFPRNRQPTAILTCSATNGEGIDVLEDALAELALGGEALSAEDTLVETARQRQALQEAVAALTAAEAGLQGGAPAELISIDMRAGLEALGSVTGANVGEAVLDRIFRDFCIGK
jgi:tRNA modification GTPase